MSVGNRNRQREAFADLAFWAAKALLTAGAIKPIFAPGPDDVLLGFGAVAAAVALLWAGFYILRRMEDE